MNFKGSEGRKMQPTPSARHSRDLSHDVVSSCLIQMQHITFFITLIPPPRFLPAPTPPHHPPFKHPCLSPPCSKPRVEGEL